MKDVLRDKSIDTLLVEFFEKLDPGHPIPDENSFSADRKTQFKAPDHFLFDRRILVERKSLQVEHDTLLGRINSVTKEQGEEFSIFGQIGINAIFRKLGDPEKAKQRYAQMAVNKFEQRIKEARDKFSEHAAATGVIAASRVIIVSEEGEAATTDGKLIEWFMGQLFLRRSATRDKVGLTDSIIYIRDPAHTISREGGHWFKWVTRERITNEQRQDISWFGEIIFGALAAHFAELGEDVDKFGRATQLTV